MKELSQEDIQVLFEDFQKKEVLFIETAAETVRKLIRSNLPKLRAAGLLNQDLKAILNFELIFDFTPATSGIQVEALIDMGTVSDSASARIVAKLR